MRTPCHITLRQAVASDARAVTDVMLASRKQLLPFAPLAHSDEAVFNWINEYLIPCHRVMVAVENTQIVGLCAMSDQDGAGWIEQLYLLPSHTGKGIGSLLVSDALVYFKGKPVQLYTFEENTSSRLFYEHHGFVAIAFSDGSNNEEGVPDVLYRRSPTHLC
ncbi:GNAT family N-acetyltransferase [Photobacterium sp. OFAV2-7]|uniref:GNAT family N-acetyltransferase n=1 Tax=Photobacterium sp. OFAV2-7 TaxID=2917748 RepID=UPI001EF41F3F|nr:GNAT family N-acetyltransferase [Photobacterium sp. OFAV2-7]MCG7585704.1 GNAT family N-acetyltransferase [Photobacterium sp. OFAV2-7]